MLHAMLAAMLATTAVADEVKPHEYRISLKCADARCTDGLAAVKAALDDLAKKNAWEVQPRNCRRDAYYLVALSADEATYARVRDRLDGGEDKAYDDAPGQCTGAIEHRSIAVEVASGEEIKADDAWEGLPLAGQEKRTGWALDGGKAKATTEYVAIWEKEPKKIDGPAVKGDVADALGRKARFVVAGQHALWLTPRALAEVELKGKPKKTKVNVLFEQTHKGDVVLDSQVLFRWKVTDGEEAAPLIEGFAKDLAHALADAGVLAEAPPAHAPKAFGPCDCGE